MTRTPCGQPTEGLNYVTLVLFAGLCLSGFISNEIEDATYSASIISFFMPFLVFDLCTCTSLLSLATKSLFLMLVYDNMVVAAMTSLSAVWMVW